MKYQFASDNTAGICPEAWKAMEQANRGFDASYGEDPWTEWAANLLREVFETNCDVYFVFNGTAANSLVLSSLCQSYHSIICHEAAHIETDECGAPEFFSHGTKILLTRGKNGKLDPDEVEKAIIRRTDIHYPKPKVVSLTQATELGTVYTPEEIREIRRVARKHGLRMHMDGARFANAVASLGVAPRELTWEAGVDVICLGGTKCGIGLGEAVVFFDRQLSLEFGYRCKQAGQLASKMRFFAAPWAAMLRDGIWLSYAAQANARAGELAKKMAAIPGIELLYPVQANGVFVRMAEHLHVALTNEQWAFYGFIGDCYRFMCSWQTTTEDIDELITSLKRATVQP